MASTSPSAEALDESAATISTLVSEAPAQHDDEWLNQPVGTDISAVAVVGLGYVGLPTALGLYDRALSVIGIDTDEQRLTRIRHSQVDLLSDDHARLEQALTDDRFVLTTDAATISQVDAVVICVPTPLDRSRVPDLHAITAACATVVRHARRGQTIILTSTSFVGTTRKLIVEPLEARRFIVGLDIHVAFGPERIDPGVEAHARTPTPRVVGGVTPGCMKMAVSLISHLTQHVHTVTSPEAAELAKLYENTFRAVTLALANEFAEICEALALDPMEVTEAAATKPYGFLATYPGPGVGGHCIPCDPHYLLWQLRQIKRAAPLTEQAMETITARPRHVVSRTSEVLSDIGRGVRGSRILVVGVSYKPGVRDTRESSALEIIMELIRRGGDVAYYDPRHAYVELPDGTGLDATHEPRGISWDLILLHTVHPDLDVSWVAEYPTILDATYRFHLAPHRRVV